MENISEKVIGILKDNIEELEGINVQKDTALITSGYVDSFDIINVISVLEEAFGINISLDDVDLEQFNTVESICSLIEKVYELYENYKSRTKSS